MSVCKGVWQSYSQSVAFESPTGLKIAHKGKKGRVLAMLLEPDGVTQLDCYPWHTRLSGTIKALRDKGLNIDTELEGECRHARYRLRTPGSLIIHRRNSEAGQ